MSHDSSSQIHKHKLKKKVYSRKTDKGWCFIFIKFFCFKIDELFWAC